MLYLQSAFLALQLPSQNKMRRFQRSLQDCKVTGPDKCAVGASESGEVTDWSLEEVTLASVWHRV